MASALLSPQVRLRAALLGHQGQAVQLPLRVPQVPVFQLRPGPAAGQRRAGGPGGRPARHQLLQHRLPVRRRRAPSMLQFGGREVLARGTGGPCQAEVPSRACVGSGPWTLRCALAQPRALLVAALPCPRARCPCSLWFPSHRWAGGQCPVGPGASGWHPPKPPSPASCSVGPTCPRFPSLHVHRPPHLWEFGRSCRRWRKCGFAFKETRAWASARCATPTPRERTPRAAGRGPAGPRRFSSPVL